MGFISTVIDVFLHLDKYLNVIQQTCGGWTYAIIFLILFCETGLVVTPFLPGDSILFATGALAAIGTLKLAPLYLIVLCAAVLGDTANYSIGSKIGTRILHHPTKLIKREYIEKAQSFYDRHGSMTIVIGRFMPIIRTFVPFVAGIGTMRYSKFITYNLLGGFLWVSLMLGLGYFFGQLPVVKTHFSVIVIVIICISVLPAIFTMIKGKMSSTQNQPE